MSRRPRGTRDTAKDIILGLAPSGQGPKAPKEGHAVTPKTPERPPRTGDDAALSRLQSQLAQMQQQNRDLATAEKAARKRLEQNQDALQRRLQNNESSGVQSRDFDDIRRQMNGVDAKLMIMNNDISGLRNSMDRQVTDLMHINNEMKSRPVVDPSKISNATSQLDSKLRDMHNQVMDLTKNLSKEQRDREKDSKTAGDGIQRLQDMIRQQDLARQDIMNNLSKKGDVDKEKLNEETRRLNDKINLITSEVTKKMTENQQKAKDDFNSRISVLESMIRAQSERIVANENEMRHSFEAKLAELSGQLELAMKQITSEKAKQKERFQKVNEALAALEHHLELGNSKIDKLMNSEIQARKLHEKGLLAKMTDIEDRVNNYVGGMNKSIDEMKNGKNNVHMPALDTDALRREMEAIAADKNKLSMEGLLKLEEKMSRVQQGFYHDRKEMTQRMTDLGDGEHVNKIRAQLNKMDALQEDMEKAQDRIRDKVERQIPQDLNELSAKADNIKHQLNTRIDNEEEERYLAIKELQEAFTTLQQSQHTGGKTAASSDQQMKRDVDECKIAIKKLAESVTTVKNVLDKKITDETKRREDDVSSIRRQMS
ncbi:t-SNARE coiled-coil homology domain-containing protein [Caenorhabditis elegans]|uniref:t-SNARE coiled-coil homology domain-containing protein n=1 Tax=Caenorhabditis elegans TaxID=6239 RepID=A0A4V0ILS0_CAEEL|nr:t-SNARE coiled-coil homology domain-containing protein [Caenorhabditis elegans]VTW47495.1 t-SNARE coiled-coil homology domain-containing protein [Caenorhabditis elegans]